jgi:hypothetical protein
LRFPLEPPASSGVRELVRKKFDRNGTIEIGIERPINHAHAAGAEPRLQLVHADLAPAFGVHGVFVAASILYRAVAAS